MSIEDEVSAARKQIYRDGYDMSIGELASLYEKEELVITPEYQRLFRWDDSKKTRFIESLLLNIPIPPIFVFSQKQSNIWELVDGLQRVSTVLQFMGILRNADKTLKEPFVCDGTRLVPSLQGVRWSNPNDDDSQSSDILPRGLQFSVRRARLRIEILGAESDPHTKYELFQRLNSGGAQLSEQEIRSCVIVSINSDVMSKIRMMAKNENFLRLVSISEERAQIQFTEELVVRFIVLRHFPFNRHINLHEYLDNGIVAICEDANFDWTREKKIFYLTMKRLVDATNANAFKKNGRFSIGMYEFIALGLSRALESSGISDRQINEKVESAFRLREAEKYSASGISATQRLGNFVFPLAVRHFKV